MPVNRCYIYNITKEFYSALKENDIITFAGSGWNQRWLGGIKDDSILWNSPASETKLPHGFPCMQKSNLNQSSSSLCACVWEREIQRNGKRQSRKNGIVRVKGVIFGIGETAKGRRVAHTRYEGTSGGHLTGMRYFHQRSKRKRKAKQDKTKRRRWNNKGWLNTEIIPSSNCWVLQTEMAEVNSIASSRATTELGWFGHLEQVL